MNQWKTTFSRSEHELSIKPPFFDLSSSFRKINGTIIKKKERYPLTRFSTFSLKLRTRYSCHIPLPPTLSLLVMSFMLAVAALVLIAYSAVPPKDPSYFRKGVICGLVALLLHAVHVINGFCSWYFQWPASTSNPATKKAQLRAAVGGSDLAPAKSTSNPSTELNIGSSDSRAIASTELTSSPSTELNIGSANSSDSAPSESTSNPSTELSIGSAAGAIASEEFITNPLTKLKLGTDASPAEVTTTPSTNVKLGTPVAPIKSSPPQSFLLLVISAVFLMLIGGIGSTAPCATAYTFLYPTTSSNSSTSSNSTSTCSTSSIAYADWSCERRSNDCPVPEVVSTVGVCPYASASPTPSPSNTPSRSASSTPSTTRTPSSTPSNSPNVNNTSTPPTSYIIGPDLTIGSTCRKRISALAEKDRSVCPLGTSDLGADLASVYMKDVLYPLNPWFESPDVDLQCGMCANAFLPSFKGCVAMLAVYTFGLLVLVIGTFIIEDHRFTTIIKTKNVVYITASSAAGRHFIQMPFKDVEVATAALDTLSTACLDAPALKGDVVMLQYTEPSFLSKMWAEITHFFQDFESDTEN